MGKQSLRARQRAFVRSPQNGLPGTPLRQNKQQTPVYVVHLPLRIQEAPLLKNDPSVTFSPRLKIRPRSLLKLLSREDIH